MITLARFTIFALYITLTIVAAGKIGQYRVDADVENACTLYDPKRATDSQYLEPNTIYLGFTKPYLHENEFKRVVFVTDSAAAGGILFHPEITSREVINAQTRKIEKIETWTQFEDIVTERSWRAFLGRIVLMIDLGVKAQSTTNQKWETSIRETLKKCKPRMMSAQDPSYNQWVLQQEGSNLRKNYNSAVWITDALVELAKDILIQAEVGPFDFFSIQGAHPFQRRAGLEASLGIKDARRMRYVDFGILRIRKPLQLDQEIGGTGQMEYNLGEVGITAGRFIPSRWK